MKRSLGRLMARGGVALIASMPLVASGQVGFFQPQEGVNAIVIGAASAPDYMGSSNNDIYAGVAARVYLWSTKRYVQLLGTQLSLNLLNNEEWSFGPQLTYRGKRDSDVENPIVARMRPLDSEVEAGVFVARSWKLSSDPRHRFSVRADVQSGEGVFATATAQYFKPVARAVVLNIGGGLAYTNGKWANHYYGVNGTDIALFPSLAGRAYNAGGGVYDFRINAGAIVHLSPSWHLAVGVRYQQLQGDAADSPIVSQQGSKDQYIVGAGIGYAWQ